MTSPTRNRSVLGLRPSGGFLLQEGEADSETANRPLECRVVGRQPPSRSLCLNPVFRPIATQTQVSRTRPESEPERGAQARRSTSRDASVPQSAREAADPTDR